MQRVFSFKFVTYMYVLADRSNLILHIHDDYYTDPRFLFGILRCLPSEPVRCELFSSTREEYSHLQEEMAITFREGQSADILFCSVMVSVNFVAFYFRKQHLNQNLTRALTGLGLRLVSNFRTTSWLSNGVK